MSGRPLTVLSVAYPFAPVGPDAVGGAEQVLSHLDAALAHAGHRSIVVAADGSRVAGTLVPTPAVHGQITDAARKRVTAAHRANLCRVLDRESVDVVHLHGIDFLDHLPPAGVPALVTLHLPPAWYPPAVWSLGRPDTHLHCVSAAQRRACPPNAVLLPTIENGVPTGNLPRPGRVADYAVALGRICPEKNFHVAFDAGTAAGVTVLLGGQVFPYADHERYFADAIAPRLAGHPGVPRHRFLGPLGCRRKQRLLTAARCLVSASIAPETSSLVAMEALACGAPVVAFPSGALADLVDHGRTGFLVRDVGEMADAVARAPEINRDECRRAARERFSTERMGAQYLSAYESLAGVAA